MRITAALWRLPLPPVPAGLAPAALRPAARLPGALVDRSLAPARAGAAAARTVGHALERELTRAGRARRRVWRGERTAHIELLATRHDTGGRPDPRAAHVTGELAAALPAALRALGGVDWASLDEGLGRVLVAFDPDEADLDEIVEAVAEAERAVVGGDPDAPAPGGGAPFHTRPDHPGDREPIVVEAVALGVDLACLGLSVAGRMCPVPALPRGTAALVALVDNQPRARAVLGSALGPAGTELVLGVASAAAGALVQAPEMLVTNAAHHCARLAERIAIHAAFARREDALGHATAAALEAGQQPPALVRPAARAAAGPEIPAVVGRRVVGPVERAADRGALAGAVLGAGGLLLGRSPALAGELVLASVPRAARVGRELFASTAARRLAARDVLTMDMGALRRLDRLDVVLIAADALLGDGCRVLTAPDAAVWGRAEGMLAGVSPWRTFRPGEVVARDGAYRLLAAGPLDGPPGGRAADAGGLALELRGRGRSWPLLLGAALDPLADAVIAAARDCGRVLLTGNLSTAELEPMADGVLGRATGVDGGPALREVAGGSGGGTAGPAGAGLATEVDRLRAGGAVVAVVSGLEAAALAAADIGIGRGRRELFPPWSADLLCTDDLADVWRVLRLAPAARSTSGRAATLATSGSALAVLTTLTGARAGLGGLAGRSVRGGPVHLAALAAMVDGAVTALRADRAHEPERVVRGDWHALPAGVALRRLGAAASAEPLAGRALVPGQRDGRHDYTAPVGPAAEGIEARPGGKAGPGGQAGRGGDLGAVGEAGAVGEVGEAGEGRSRPRAAARVARAVLADLRDPLVPVLLVGAAASAMLGSSADAALVAGVSVTNALVSGAQRARAEGALARLVARHVPVARQLTPHGPALVAASALRTGDLVELRPNDVVPADGRLIRAERLEIDEATLTGESLPVSKTTDPTPTAAVADRACMVYEGTTVLAGSGTALVVATGASTQSGRARGAAGAVVPAGAQARLGELTRLALPLTGAAGAAVTALSSLRGAPLRSALSAGVAVAVAAVPEGLPLVATVSQVAAARRLARAGVLVRSSRTVEALGRLDVVCFDKTGTLTEGRLVPRAVMVPAGRTAWRRHALPGAHPLDAAAELVVRTAAAACPTGAEASIHATDRAVLAAAADLPVPAAPAERLAELGFETSRGYAATLTCASAPAPGAERAAGPSDVAAGAAARTTVARTTANQGAMAATLAVKGAPEVVIGRCVLTPAASRAARRAAEQLAGQGLRVLAVAAKSVELYGPGERPASAPRRPGAGLGARSGPGSGAARARRAIADGDVRDLRLVGLLGLADTPRPSAIRAVRRLSEAGVRVTMVTGDHPATAAAIAAEVGLPGARLRQDRAPFGARDISGPPGARLRQDRAPFGLVVTGAELDRLDDAGYARRIAEADVFARVSPEQKVRLVRALRRDGRVVAMTGDGTNDAAAIRAADVGVAITGQGSAAAQGAADLLLADSDVEALAGAVVEGRRMWDAVTDAVSVLVGGNAGEVVFTLIGTAIAGSAPLNPRQLLLVNLLTDMAPAMALAVRGPDADGRSRGPGSPGDPHGSVASGGSGGPGDGRARLRQALLARGTLTAAGATSAWLLARTTGTPRRASTVALLALVGTQLGQTVVLARRDPLVVATAVGSAALMATLVQTPVASSLFGSRPVGPLGWGIAVGCASGASLLALAYDHDRLDWARPAVAWAAPALGRAVPALARVLTEPLPALGECVQAVTRQAGGPPGPARSPARPGPARSLGPVTDRARPPRG